MDFTELKNSGILIPQIIFGTSALGNLYVELDEKIKKSIVEESIRHIEGKAVFDSAGKYGAGLALTKLGEKLRELKVSNDDVIISNKLGWLQTSLQGMEPTFERGVWKNIGHDARLAISYEGIIECWEQGNKLLGSPYKPRLVSVHDPDEYLSQAGEDPSERRKRFAHIIDAYRALSDLKSDGKVNAIGIGAKNWKIIHELSKEVELDWVMLANSFTIYSHPVEMLQFIDELGRNNITVINSAVFNAGFLTGGSYFDYQHIDTHPERSKLLAWREKFFKICTQFEVNAADACVNFGLSHPAVQAVALNTSKPKNVARNIASTNCSVPEHFYRTMRENQLIQEDYPYL